MKTTPADKASQKEKQWKDHQELRLGKKTRVSKKALDGAWSRSQPSAKTQPVVVTEPAVAACTNLAQLRTELGDCTRCKLHSTRTNIVFGEGNPQARLMFVGEGPGQSEDEQGRPFVGRAGQLLTKIIEAMGLRREDVFIANVVKCRPPANRVPERDEVATCSPFLFRQINIIKPQVIVALGATSLKCLFGDDAKISEMRGRFVDYHGVQLMPTFHPAYLLRNPPAKKEVWADMQVVMKKLGIKPPKRPATQVDGKPAQQF
jgi:DNA polymerase